MQEKQTKAGTSLIISTSGVLQKDSVNANLPASVTAVLNHRERR